MTDKYALEDAINRSGKTKKEIAAHLELSEQGFLLKLNNKTEFKASEIDKLCKLLNLKDKKIFFCRVARI